LIFWYNQVRISFNITARAKMMIIIIQVNKKSLKDDIVLFPLSSQIYSNSKPEKIPVRKSTGVHSNIPIEIARRIIAAIILNKDLKLRVFIKHRLLTSLSLQRLEENKIKATAVKRKLKPIEYKAPMKIIR
jgi:hypothetical protein